MNIIEVRDAGLVASGRPLLQRVNLRVDRGEVVALLGENGSGKSTLVKMILGLRAATSGEVRLFDTPLGQFHQWHRVGYVPQRSAAASGVPATVWEVVASGRLSRRRIFAPLGSRGRSAISGSLKSVDLTERAHDPFDTLSGGQQQRALIARALAAEPELFVLDEPNAGVDTANQEALASTLEVLVSLGATVLVVLHELGPMAPLVDRTVVIHDGKITQDGVPLAHSHGAHHHHAQADLVSHVPPLSAPLDRSPLERGGTT